MVFVVRSVQRAPVGRVAVLGSGRIMGKILVISPINVYSIYFFFSHNEVVVLLILLTLFLRTPLALTIHTLIL